MNSIRQTWRGLSKPVFVPASILIIALIAFAVIYTNVSGDEEANPFDALSTGIANGVGWCAFERLRFLVSCSPSARQ